MRGTLLDRALGRRRRPGTLYNYTDDFEILPEKIRSNLLKGRQFSGKRGPQMSSVSWRDTLTPRDVMIADGTAITNTTTETIMCPDFTFAARALEVGDWFKYNLWFRHSTVITTPGTITFKLRWGGVAGTTLATSGAFAPDPTAASTNLTGHIEWTVVCRATGATGSLFAVARIDWNDFDDASATTLKGNLDMNLVPTVTPAAVTVDTTAQSALSPTVTFSVNTATTSLTNHIAILESCN